MDSFPSVARLSEHVVRVLGQNPGQFTLQGTNTYLIGRRRPYILLDTGERGRDSYLPLLASALRDPPPSDPEEQDISDVVITHRHHDHVGGLPAVLRLIRDLWIQRNPNAAYNPPRIHKFPLPANHPKDDRLQLAIDSLEPETYSAGPTSPFHDLSDGQLLQYTTSSPALGPSTALQILHTPGHTADSICLYFPADKALFTGDTVLGGSTSVFEDLGPYLTSLRRMLTIRASLPYTQLYPAHGNVVADGPKMIEMYIRHRMDRERRVLEVLGETTQFGDSTWTVWGIVEKMYGGITRDLWNMAAHGIELHLKKLAEDGRVHCRGGEGKYSQWELSE